MSGNDEQYALENVKPLEKSPLAGKRIAFLGSSVTEGECSRHVSFVEYLARRNSFVYVKEALSGTTLVDNKAGSYIQRMRSRMDKNDYFDLFVCQLSTNDAAKKMSLGTVADTRRLEDFDTASVTGAMEYIICYVRDTWKCPVVFYTGSRYDNDRYGKMVAALYQLREKWGIEIIDLWHGLDTSVEAYDLYMADPVHPTQAGYLKWWVPFMEARLYEIVGSAQKMQQNGTEESVKTSAE